MKSQAGYRKRFIARVMNKFKSHISVFLLHFSPFFDKAEPLVSYHALPYTFDALSIHIYCRFYSNGISELTQQLHFKTTKLSAKAV